MKRQRLGIIFIAICITGCAAQSYKVHPGSGGYISGTPSPTQLFISQGYDTLSAASAIIDQTRTDFLANKFPASVMPAIRTAFNSLVAGYDTTQASWITFNQQVTGGANPSQAALQAALSGVQTAVTNLSNAKAGQ